MTGWLFASFRGWSVSYFYLVPVPMLAAKNTVAIRQIDGWHQIAEWTLLITIGIHVAAALAHIFIYRDRILQRMLPSSGNSLQGPITINARVCSRGTLNRDISGNWADSS